MGCVSSKQAVSVTPAIDHSGALRDNAGAAGSFGSNSGRSRIGFSELEKKTSSFSGGSKKKKNSNSGVVTDLVVHGGELGESGRASWRSDSLSLRLGNLQKYIEGEQAAAGWPAWLSAVAGEAIHGWVPLKADSFEKLEKIGQGTYSTVFRARDHESGKIVALKKVRFDNFDPESVQFMAREILILRRLDHPNIIKLEGIITSRMSYSIFLVFEYMEHDVTGLLSCPDIKFCEPQIKCYVKQLLSGLDHCHSQGIMHRDIKGSNLLVNNEGILKIADFGLANFYILGKRQPLTSRVVTLWYRPPELLLGSTSYTAAVDLWSVGCVFAELLLRKPILQGRTEVEQLHKIFKLCGSPPEDYWKNSKLPHATLFKPQQPYHSCLRETFKGLPATAVNLVETLLSVEPHKRGTASSALASEYFTTKPYACDPSSLPVYPPSKEIDAKYHEEAKRKKISRRVCGPETRNPIRKPHGISKLALVEDCAAAAETRGSRKINGNHIKISKQKTTTINAGVPNPSTDAPEETSNVKHESQGDIPFFGLLQVSSSSGFAWAKRRKDDASIRSLSRSISRGHIHDSFDPFAQLHAKNNIESKHENGDVIYGGRTDSRGLDSYEAAKRAMQKQWSQFERPDSFNASDEYHSQELSLELYRREEMLSKRNNSDYQDEVDKVEFSGPLLCQSHRVDELLERHERHVRQAIRKSWFQRGTLMSNGRKKRLSLSTKVMSRPPIPSKQAINNLDPMLLLVKYNMMGGLLNRFSVKAAYDVRMATHSIGMECAWDRGLRKVVVETYSLDVWRMLKYDLAAHQSFLIMMTEIHGYSAIGISSSTFVVVVGSDYNDYLVLYSFLGGYLPNAFDGVPLHLVVFRSFNMCKTSNGTCLGNFDMSHYEDTLDPDNDLVTKASLCVVLCPHVYCVCIHHPTDGVFIPINLKLAESNV
ncbi:hypothetical protein V6N12_012802 [Hibiscus sabdariffa]|uniref:Protein kinase domain-containing protein n=1 Tax=Hibiscus sabdariffa TaxID=183260 RepID=A0ABR2EHS6_9ROSI